MTLVVNSFVRDPATGEVVSLPWPAAGEELAGVEACRRTLWGSRAARELGLVLLPTLADHDLYVESDELDRLEREVQLVLGHLDELARATGYTDEYIEHRAANILRAIGVAREHAHGGVVIF